MRERLQELQPLLDPGSKLQVGEYATGSRYWVRREVSSSESRVDIEIAASGKFIIHIENKILSSEGGSQTEREWRDLNKRAKELEIPQENRHALFLTLDGRPPADDHFLPVGWACIAKILDEFARQAQPPYVSLFVRHYAEAIRKYAASAFRQEGVLHGEAVIQ